MRGGWNGGRRVPGLWVCFVLGLACADGEPSGRDPDPGSRDEDSSSEEAIDRGPGAPDGIGSETGSDPAHRDLSEVHADVREDSEDAQDDASENEGGVDLGPDPGGGPDGTVRLVALDRPGEVLAGASGPDGRAWLVGRDGLVLRSDGEDFWPFPSPPGSADLTGVSVSGGAVFVVDTRGAVHRFREEEGWRRIRDGDGSPLHDVAAVSDDEFWAVGEGGRVLYGVGDEVRTEVTGITYDLFGVQASREGGVRAVGRYGTLLTRGSVAWERTTIGLASVTLRAIWRAADGWMVAVGDRGVVVRHDGISWKMDLTNETEDPPRDLHAVLGTASDEILAAGDGGAVFRFDGRRWNRQTVAGPGGVRLPIRALTIRRTNEGSWTWTAAGLGPQALEPIEGVWKDRALGVTTSLHGVSIDPEGNAVAVGEQGVVIRWRVGERPRAFRAPVPGDLLAVSWPFAVGQGGALVRLDESPMRARSLSREDLTAVAVGTGGAWITDAGGALWRWTEERSEIRATRPFPLWAVAESEGLVWIAGGDGRLEVDDGEGFRSVATGTFSTFRALWPMVGQRVVVAGDFGLVLECLPTQCRRAFEDPATFFFALGENGGVPVAAGWAGVLIRRNADGMWRTLESGTRRVFRGIAGLPGGGAVLVGLDGTLGALDPWPMGVP